MPENTLTKDSSPQVIRDWIGKYIATCIKEGKDQKQCAGIAYDMAREATGKDIGREA